MASRVYVPPVKSWPRLWWGNFRYLENRTLKLGRLNREMRDLRRNPPTEAPPLRYGYTPRHSR